MSDGSRSYQQRLNERLRALTLSPPPEPWRHAASVAVGGFEALGFSADSRHLLVISGAGRGVFDGRTGELLARDPAYGEGDWYDARTLTAQGIGPLEGDAVRVAGIHGGGLPIVTQDDWVADLLAPDWPASFVCLSAPGSSPFTESRGSGVVKVAPLAGDDLIRCHGFSWAMASLVVATSGGFDLFVR